MEEPEQSPVAQPLLRESAWAGVKKAVPAVVLAVTFGLLAFGIANRVGTNFGLPMMLGSDPPDAMSRDEKEALARRFAGNGAVALQAVRLRQTNDAIALMGFSLEQEKAFRADLAAQVLRDRPTPAGREIARYIETLPPPAEPAVAAAPPASAPVAIPVVSQNGGAATATQPAPVPAATPAPRPKPAPVPLPATLDPETTLPLAWISLWDHKDPDGDVVRVISAGYSRTVALLNEPVTLVLPVPPSGIVNVMGVTDGQGGITVGIGSAAMGVALPVLSEGQIVGVPVMVK